MLWISSRIGANFSGTCSRVEGNALTTSQPETIVMKHQLAATVSALFLAAVAAPVHATTTTFIASLGALGEPVPTSLATGFATVSFDDVLNTVSVQLSFSGLASAAPFGHIHCCTAAPGTGSGPVALGFTNFPAAASGTYSANLTVFSGASTFATLLAGAKAGTAYANIHTPGTYAGGEIRGFLAPIPEPETYALMLAGLGAVAWAARRRSV
jgi:CHRD domain/PEP-CTERM motif